MELVLSRVDERNSDSYIGRIDFFSGKVLKFIQAQIYVFAVWLLISF